MQLPLLAFLLLKLQNLLTAHLAPSFIKYLGHFSHPKVLDYFSLPKFIESFANFDGLFYIRISRQGYEQFEQAFFPLFPVLINKLSLFFAYNHLLTGLLISNLSFLIGLFVFKKYLDSVLKNNNKVFWTIVFLITFPTAFFFGALYTEGLFFLFVVLTFYFLKKENYLLTSLFAFLAATTRFIGLFLVVPIVLYIFLKEKKLNFNLPKLTATFAPVLGLGSYGFYLWKTFGDPLLFFTSQTAFSAGRSTKLILFPQVYFRYLKIFLNTPLNFQFFISLLEISVFTTVFFSLLWFLYKNWREGNVDLTVLSVFSLINVLVPTLTGTFLSIPRFALISLSFFILLSEVKKPKIKLAIAVFFIFLHTVLLAFFIQGYFVS